ncbi:MAG TPA: DNA repair protein RecO [Candidatus Saccharimonadia bacterium]|nr:DNA repair protein RecO [Candidatus Saccharimonadia bacterium]
MKTFSTDGIVLKRFNAGEADRILTVFTRDLGKIACIAKGVRKTTSTKRSALEPGSLAKIFCAETHGMPILTQATLVDDFSRSRETLAATRSLSQVLEIVDAVTVEGEGQEGIFDLVLATLHELSAEGAQRRKVLQYLQTMLEELGFQSLDTTRFSSISEYVEFLSDKKMRSFAYLTVKR